MEYYREKRKTNKHRLHAFVEEIWELYINYYALLLSL